MAFDDQVDSSGLAYSPRVGVRYPPQSILIVVALAAARLTLNTWLGAPWRLAVAASACLVLAGCADGAPAATASPTDSFLQPRGVDASGPIDELGAADAFDSAWRLGIYPTGDGWCLQLALDDLISARCEDLVPEGDAAFGSVGQRTAASTGVTVVDGIVTDEVATVWLIAEDQRRLPALLIPLSDWDVEGQAFLGSAPADMRLTHVMAVGSNGEVLQTHALP